MLMPMKVKLLGLIATLLIFLSGCAGTPKLEKPAVTVDDITVENLVGTTLELEVRVIVSNPNPVGAHLTKLVFDIYYLEDSSPKYLGHGEKHDIDIRKQGDTTITIPVTIDSLELVRTLVDIARKGSVTLKVSGSAYLDLKVMTFEIPFERTKEVALKTFITKPTPTPGVSEYKETEEVQTPTPILTPVPTPEKVEKVEIIEVLLRPRPAKVGEDITVIVQTQKDERVSNAHILSIDAVEVAKTLLEASTGSPVALITLAKSVAQAGEYHGKTNSNGELTISFTEPSEYVVVAVKGPGLEGLKDTQVREYLRSKSTEELVKTGIKVGYGTVLVKGLLERLR